MNEIKYFNCNVDNLVSLRDYLLQLKKKKAEYNKLIKEPLESIQKKNIWCTDVQPEIDCPFIMKVESKNYPTIWIEENNGSFGYNDISYNTLNPFSEHMI